MCIETPSPPDECDRLACEERNQECRIITVLNVTRAMCGPISDCSRLSCNESEGLECRVGGEGQAKFAFCARTSNCSRIRCNESQGLECRVVGEGVVSAAVCLVTRNCSVLNPICRRGGLVCQEPQSQGDFAQASCVVATSCEELECNRGFVCQEFTLEESGDGESGGDVSGGDVSGGDVSGGDVSGGGVSGGDVSGGDVSGGDVSGGGVSGGGVSGGGVSGGGVSGGGVSGGDVSGGDVSGGDVSGGDVSGGDVSSGSGVLPSTVTPSTEIPTSATRQPTVDSGSGSGNTPIISVSTSGPVTSTSPPRPQTVARCVSNNIRASCNELVCEENQVCSLVRYPSRNISIARCAGRDTVPQPQLFELGTVCEGRTVACPVGTECLEVAGAVAGTLCNTPPNVISCDNVECTSIAECIQSEVDGIPLTAFCLSSATVDTVVSGIVM